MLDELVDEVGSDAARYFFVMRNYNTHLDFDIELAKEQSEKNPVFYVQYAYARVCSIFTHAQEKGVPDYNINDADFTALEPEEEELILHMIGLPDIIKEAAEKYSPSVLVAAAFDIVSKFHSFYNKHRVVSDNKGETARRIVILKGLKKTMETCFEIIGITARTRM
jgi:arginyl-tRNA synthetase